MKGKKLFLIRHAESYQNVGLPVMKEEAIRLTDRGITQAKELASELTEPKLIAVSKYLRAILTAEPLFEKYPEVPVEIWTNIHEFNYLDLSEVVGNREEYKEAKFREYWERMDPFFHDGDAESGLESFEDFLLRVFLAATKMRNLVIEGNVYIFSHFDVIKLLLVLFKDYPNIKSREQLELSQTEVMKKFWTRYSEGEIDNVEVIELILN